jgi:hypothetical protein
MDLHPRRRFSPTAKSTPRAHPRSENRRENTKLAWAPPVSRQSRVATGKASISLTLATIGHREGGIGLTFRTSFAFTLRKRMRCSFDTGKYANHHGPTHRN